MPPNVAHKNYNSQNQHIHKATHNQLDKIHKLNLPSTLSSVLCFSVYATFVLILPELRQLVLLVIHRRRKIINNENPKSVVAQVAQNGIARPALILMRCAISMPRHVPQYVDNSVSNVPHLPAVNYRIQRRIKKYESE